MNLRNLVAILVVCLVCAAAIAVGGSNPFTKMGGISASLGAMVLAFMLYIDDTEELTDVRADYLRLVLVVLGSLTVFGLAFGSLLP